jgi:hypothetical protein
MMILHESTKAKLIFHPRKPTDCFAVVVVGNNPITAISYSEALEIFEKEKECT